MKRAFVANLRSGSIELDADEAHHLASVLRASVSESIEIFDEFGATAQATIETVDRKKVIVRVDRIEPAPANRPIVSVCTAVPKGERADWMIEKLSEVGCDRLMLLQTSRSVVTPQGQNKWTRWRRITIESAKQCRRVGVMKIRDELLKLDAISDQPVMLSESDNEVRATKLVRLVASLRPSARPLIDLNLLTANHVEIFIGPEGDFSDDEYEQLVKHGAIEVALTPTVMRVETAAVVACSMVSQMLGKRKSAE